MKLTQEELIAMATERFGADPLRWAFVCPNCKDVATPQDFRDAGADPDRIGQECIGRSLGALTGGAKRGCNWAAYGLLGGPWSVTVKDEKGERSISSFALAEVPA
jgi:hypothetical protein